MRKFLSMTRTFYWCVPQCNASPEPEEQRNLFKTLQRVGCALGNNHHWPFRIAEDNQHVWHLFWKLTLCRLERHYKSTSIILAPLDIHDFREGRAAMDVKYIICCEVLCTGLQLKIFIWKSQERVVIWREYAALRRKEARMMDSLTLLFGLINNGGTVCVHCFCLDSILPFYIRIAARETLTKCKVDSRRLNRIFPVSQTNHFDKPLYPQLQLCMRQRPSRGISMRTTSRLGSSKRCCPQYIMV